MLTLSRYLDLELVLTTMEQTRDPEVTAQFRMTPGHVEYVENWFRYVHVTVCSGAEVPVRCVPEAAVTGPSSVGTGASSTVRVNTAVMGENPAAAGVDTVMTHVPGASTRKKKLFWLSFGCPSHPDPPDPSNVTGKVAVAG
jgi:hypothetical protein